MQEFEISPEKVFFYAVHLQFERASEIARQLKGSELEQQEGNVVSGILKSFELQGKAEGN